MKLTSLFPPFRGGKGRDVSYDAPVVKAHQFPQHFEFNAVGWKRSATSQLTVSTSLPIFPDLYRPGKEEM